MSSVRNLEKRVLLIVREDELEDLSEILAILHEAGYEEQQVIVVKHVDSRCYVGKGKLEEIKNLVKKYGVRRICVFDNLKPRHYTCLMKELSVEVLDKVMIILEIFDRHAGSKEAKLQIELAKLKHELPLIRDWLRRIKLRELPGFLGAGEYAVDAYYRHVKKRITRISHELEELRRKREHERRKRKEIGFPHIAIVGYTNSGKTTLFNALTNLNKPTGYEMFTTLSAKTYAVKLCDEMVALVDTVGFIKRIPMEIIEAFKAVLEEISDAEGIVLVLDASEEVDTVLDKLDSSITILKRIGAYGKPVIVALNKVDLVSPDQLNECIRVVQDFVTTYTLNVVDIVAISALKRININKLKEGICSIVKHCHKISLRQSMY